MKRSRLDKEENSRRFCLKVKRFRDTTANIFIAALEISERPFSEKTHFKMNIQKWHIQNWHIQK